MAGVQCGRPHFMPIAGRQSGPSGGG
eukprot:SAG31_NODE_44147_length_264_cov_0.624242_1_plen_25_part_10